MNPFEQQWQQLLAKEPGLSQPEGNRVMLTIAELKAIVEQFYGAGRSAGVQRRTTSMFNEFFGVDEEAK